MLRVKNISKTYHSGISNQRFQALNDISFEIEQGKIIGFLGANGAGKTTLIKILMNLIRPDQGDIDYRFFGKNQNEIFSKISFLPERPYFYHNLKGEDWLYYAGELHQIPKKDIVEQINRWAPSLKIDHALKRPLKGYSKGMLQRVGLLSCILNRPKLLVLDEPLSGLDPFGRKEFKDIIKNLHQEGSTVFFSSHILSDVEEISDHIIFIEKGELKYDGPLYQLMSNEKSATYKIHYYENDKINDVSVSSEDKQNVLQTLIQDGFHIESIKRDRSNLEEVLYRHE